MNAIWVIGFIVVFFGFVVFRGAPYVPSRRRYITQAFTELYPLTKKDVLVDVGSGDGVVLRVASEFGARVIGIELQPALFVITKWLSRHDPNVEVRLADFWLTEFPDDTTVVYAFIVSRDVKKMIKKMQSETNRIGHSLRFITYGNSLNDRQHDKAVAGYRLYTFYPLQTPKP